MNRKSLTRGVLVAVIGICAGVPGPRAQDAPAGQKQDPARALEPSESAGRPASVVPAEKDRKRHEQFLKDKEAAQAKGDVQLVFIGDSITDAWRGGAQNKLFQERWGRYNPINLGLSGDQTQHVLWRLEHGELDGIKPKAVVMMIGTNNFGNNRPPHGGQDVAAGVEKLVQTIRQKQPQAKVLLLGIFPRGQKADDPHRARIKEANERLAKLDDGGKTVRFLDIGQQFLQPDGSLSKEIMPDYLHLSPKGYQIWADAIGPALEELMKGE